MKGVMHKLGRWRPLVGFSLLGVWASAAEPVIGPKKVPPLAHYSSNDDVFASFKPYLSGTTMVAPFTLARGNASSDPYMMLATSEAKVGMNKAIKLLVGRIVFEYKIPSDYLLGPNVFMYVIPIQAGPPDQTIEVGAQKENMPQNGFSPYRAKFVAPRQHYKSGQWHTGEIAFDFRTLPNIGYAIIAPRLNEGATAPGPGSMHIRNVRVFGAEVP